MKSGLTKFMNRWEVEMRQSNNRSTYTLFHQMTACSSLFQSVPVTAEGVELQYAESSIVCCGQGDVGKSGIGDSIVAGTTGGWSEWPECLIQV